MAKTIKLPSMRIPRLGDHLIRLATLTDKFWSESSRKNSICRLIFKNWSKKSMIQEMVKFNMKSSRKCLKEKGKWSLLDFLLCSFLYSITLWLDFTTDFDIWKKIKIWHLTYLSSIIGLIKLTESESLVVEFKFDKSNQENKLAILDPKATKNPEIMAKTISYMLRLFPCWVLTASEGKWFSTVW